MIDKWKPLEAKGVAIHVGEFGCFNKTPHDVALAWLGDCLSLWKEAGWGFAMWNLRGALRRPRQRARRRRVRGLQGPQARPQAAGAAAEPLSVRLRATGALFFLSGALGLLYEVVWFRRLHLALGVSIFAVGAVLSAFMLGLALGSRWAGAERAAPPGAARRLRGDRARHRRLRCRVPGAGGGRRGALPGALRCARGPAARCSRWRGSRSRSRSCSRRRSSWARACPRWPRPWAGPRPGSRGAWRGCTRSTHSAASGGRSSPASCSIERLGLTRTLWTRGGGQRARRRARAGAVADESRQGEPGPGDAAGRSRRTGGGSRATVEDPTPRAAHGRGPARAGVNSRPPRPPLTSPAARSPCRSPSRPRSSPAPSRSPPRSSGPARSSSSSTTRRTPSARSWPCTSSASPPARLSRRVSRAMRPRPCAVSRRRSSPRPRACCSRSPRSDTCLRSPACLAGGRRLAPGLTGGGPSASLVVGSWADALVVIFGQVAVVLFLPALLLGAVFPLALAMVSPRDGSAAGHVGRLYAVNAVGSVAGTLVGTFVLVAALGTRGALVLLAWLPLPVALWALRVSRPSLKTQWAALCVVPAMAGPHRAGGAARLLPRAVREAVRPGPVVLGGRLGDRGRLPVRGRQPLDPVLRRPRRLGHRLLPGRLALRAPAAAAPPAAAGRPRSSASAPATRSVPRPCTLCSGSTASSSRGRSWPRRRSSRRRTTTSRRAAARTSSSRTGGTTCSPRACATT